MRDMGMRRGGRGGGNSSAPRRYHHPCSALCVRALVLLALAMEAVSLPCLMMATTELRDVCDGRTVAMLNALTTVTGPSATQAMALWHGLDAALYHKNYTTATGLSINTKDSITYKDLPTFVTRAMAAYSQVPCTVAVVGVTGDSLVRKLVPYLDLHLNGTIFLFSPFTGSSAVRGWSNNVYFTQAEPRLELMAMMKRIAGIIRARRVAFAYLTGRSFGDLEYGYAVSMLRTLSIDPPSVYAVPFSETDSSVNATAFGAMADTHPQVVIVWAEPSASTVKLLEKVFTDPRTRSMYVMVPFLLQHTAFVTYYNLAADGLVTPTDGQLMSSAPLFPVTKTSTLHLEMFKAQMGVYMAQTGRIEPRTWADEARIVERFGKPPSVPPSSSSRRSSVEDFLREHPCTANQMMAGWIVGSVMWQTLRNPKWAASGAAYWPPLFDQRRYVVGEDFVLGDYGGYCDNISAFLGASCQCNQGGRTALLMELKSAAWYEVAKSAVHYSQAHCYSTYEDLPKPLNALTLVVEDNAVLATATRAFTEVMTAAVKCLDHEKRPLTVVPLTVTESAAQELLKANLLNHRVDVLCGVMTAVPRAKELLVPDPIFVRARLAVQEKNYIYIMPTLEQQIYLLYANMAQVRGVTSIGEKAKVILHGYPSDQVVDIVDVLYKSAATFHCEALFVTNVPSGAAIADSLKPDMLNVVLGMTEDDVNTIAAFLAAQPTSVVVVFFDELSLYYEVLVRAFSLQPVSVQARLISFSNLPLWSDASAAAAAAHPLLRLLHAILPDPSKHTPTALRILAGVTLMQEVARAHPDANVSEAVELLYGTDVLTAYGMTYGRFHWGCLRSDDGKVCLYKNYGAQDIVMLSMQRMLDPTVPVVAAATTPTMVYAARVPQLLLTPAQRYSLIVGCLLATLVIAVGVALLMYHRRKGSFSGCFAPKVVTDPVTFVVTDVESSTALWAALPQLMAEAIAAHHRLIRQAIRKRACYEVKTMGDSFIIACKDAYTAARLACDVQTRLQEHNWETDAIDRNYREFERRRAADVSGYAPPAAGLGLEEYRAAWRGLRVRMGLHTGLADIRYNEATKEHEYYGDTPNMAARTEAVANGGQVLATEGTWWALSDRERDALVHEDLGPQELRGVRYAVEMYQLNAVPGRSYAPLGRGKRVMLHKDDAKRAASRMALVISVCFATYTAEERAVALQLLLQRWHVGTPPQPRYMRAEDYCKLLINRLAERLASIAKARIDIDRNRATREDAPGVVATADANDGASNSVTDGGSVFGAAGARLLDSPRREAHAGGNAPAETPEGSDAPRRSVPPPSPSITSTQRSSRASRATFRDDVEANLDT